MFVYFGKGIHLAAVIYLGLTSVLYRCMRKCTCVHRPFISVGMNDLMAYLHALSLNTHTVDHSRPVCAVAVGLPRVTIYLSRTTNRKIMQGAYGPVSYYSS